MIDRHLLRYFLAVVDTGSFSAAATLCRVSQPTVSAGIARLESSLGQMLFNRTNRRVEMTEAGARLVAHARRIESEFVEAQRAVANVQPATLVRLGVAATIATDLVERIAADCLRDAGTRLEIVERRPSEMAWLLDRGRVDLVLGPMDRETGRNRIELFREPYRLVMRADHPLAAREVVTCEDLADEPMLVRRQCEALPLVSQFFTTRGIRPFMAARSLMEARIAAYVRAGLGVTVMPLSLVDSGMVARPLTGLDISRTVGLILEPGEHGRLARSGIVDLIRSAARRDAA